MNRFLVVVLFLINLRTAISRLDKLKTVDDYMNICLNGTNHKDVPGPEPLLSTSCSPWVNRSCCTAETSHGIQVGPRWLNFDWDHCQTLSPSCREHFVMDLCFYECSPNVGPWLVKDIRKIRQERFKNVPLCQSGCNNWWRACKNEFTCLDNWAVGFNWSTGINTCPQGSSCQPFNKTYSSANNFCETLMGQSFKVVPDNEDCFVTWFDNKLPNPNEAIARKKASEILGVPYIAPGNGSQNITIKYFIYKMSILFYLLLHN